MSRFIAVLLAALVIDSTSQARAQPSAASPAADSAALLRALGAALSQAGARQVVRQFGCHDGAHPCRTPDGTHAEPLLVALAAAAGAPLVAPSARPVPPCPWGYAPPREGAGFRVEVGDPIIRGDSATVLVVQYCDNPPEYLHDVFSQDDLYVLMREAGHWRVVGRRMRRITRAGGPEADDAHAL